MNTKSEVPAGSGSLDPLFGIWHPIETAPKDGSKFLVLEPFEPTVECAWINEDDELAPCSNRSWWWKKPTHWMPLPDINAQGYL
ncbi:MAG: hypothetical protein WCS65_13550 [Verrucomicrobiae bacterium]